MHQLTSQSQKSHFSKYYTYTYNINICVPRICLDCQNCLCPKVAKFNLFNLTTGKFLEKTLI